MPPDDALSLILHYHSTDKAIIPVGAYLHLVYLQQ